MLGTYGRLAVIGLAVTLVSPVFGDWIRLKGGAQVHGKIILQNDERVTLKSKKGTFSFDAKRVVEIHRTSPLPKSEAEKKAEQKALEKANSTGVVTPIQAEARELKLGDCRVTLPLTFTLKRSRSKIAGYDGELLGLYEEKKTGAFVSLSTDGKLPLGAADLTDLFAKVREHLGAKKGTKVMSIKKLPIDSQPSLLAEFVESRGGQKVRVLQAWTRDDTTCYSLSVSVPDTKYRLNSLRYSKIVKSFRRR